MSTPVPIDTILSPEQVAALRRWLEAGKTVPGLLGGYPLGKCYIDDRARGGHGYAERRAYVRLDDETALLVPQLRGFYGPDIARYLEQRWGRPIDLTKQERNTVLAALRYYQSQGMGEPCNRSDEIHDIATDGDETSLDDAGIDHLCERINGA